MSKIFPTWVTAWLWASTIICALDVTFTILRPYTNDPNNILSYTIFYGWNLYAMTDARYASTTDIVTCATGRVMIIEIVLNVVALVMEQRKSRHALLTAFFTTVMVWWKTVWFLTLYAWPPAGNEPFLNPAHSDIRKLFIFWIPNGVWVVVPTAVIIGLWNKLALPLEYQEQHNNSYEKPPGLPDSP